MVVVMNEKRGGGRGGRKGRRDEGDTGNYYSDCFRLRCCVRLAAALIKYLIELADEQTDDPGDVDEGVEEAPGDPPVQAHRVRPHVQYGGVTASSSPSGHLPRVDNVLVAVEAMLPLHCGCCCSSL